GEDAGDPDVGRSEPRGSGEGICSEGGRIAAQAISAARPDCAGKAPAQVKWRSSADACSGSKRRGSTEQHLFGRGSAYSTALSAFGSGSAPATRDGRCGRAPGGFPSGSYSSRDGAGPDSPGQRVRSQAGRTQ